MGDVAYSKVTTQKVYDALIAKCRQTLLAKRAVIVDAVFSTPEERQAVEQVARDLNLPFQGLWLSAPSDLLLERVAKRQGDASDADQTVVRQQLARDVGPLHWTVIDTRNSLSEIETKVSKLLEAFV